MLVLAISACITETSKKIDLKAQKKFEFKQILSIYYPAQFRKFLIEVFIDSNNKGIIIEPSLTRKLCL